MNRRHLLHAAALAGVGTMLTSGDATQANGQSAPATPNTTTRAKEQDAFFEKADLNDNFLTVLGFARHDLVDVGSALAIASQITAGDPCSVARAFTSTGDQFATIDDAATAVAHGVSAHLGKVHLAKQQSRHHPRGHVDRHRANGRRRTSTYKCNAGVERERGTGESMQYRIPLVPNARRFATGHRLRISLVGDGQPADTPDFRHTRVGTSSTRGVAATSRLSFPVHTIRDAR